MANLANATFALGRRTDALELQEKVLDFFHRVLPEDHPNTGEADVCLMICTC